MFQTKNKAIGWGVFLSVVFLGIRIGFVPDYNTGLLFGLILAAILVVLFRQTFAEPVLVLSRLLLGALFVYSGFVKGVDPVGTMYRIEDYFIAFGMDWARALALPLSVLLNGWEFLLGIALLFNIRMRITRWLIAATMLLFTLVTLNDALYSPVPDCGCFGDALIITNWQTYYKNLVIDALLLIVFLNVERSRTWFRLPVELMLVGFFAVAFLYFQVYNIRHLPVLDFRAWKVGNKMSHNNPLPKKYYLSYQNTQTGEVEEYLSPDYPYNDSVWVATHEFVRQRVVDPNPPLHDLHLEDADGTNFTPEIIENSDWQYIVVAEDLDKTHEPAYELIRDFVSGCQEEGVGIVMITSSLPDQVAHFLSDHSLDIDVYYADDIALKAMIRSNPGLVLMKEGVVMGKWHYNDWPEVPDTSSIGE